MIILTVACLVVALAAVVFAVRSRHRTHVRYIVQDRVEEDVADIVDDTLALEDMHTVNIIQGMVFCTVASRRDFELYRVHEMYMAVTRSNIGPDGYPRLRA